MTELRELWLLLSARVAERHGEALRAAAREGKRALAPVVLPADPQARLPPGACAQLEAAYFSGDLLADGARAFFAAALGAPQLRWLQTFNAGTDHPIFARILERGVRLTTAAGASAEPIAQTALAALLMLARGFPRWLDAQRRRAWEPLPADAIPRDLRGQTLVVFGLGAIGSELARLARALGLRVVGVRRTPARGDEPVDALVPPERLREVLPRADWLAIACPLTAETRGAIDAAALALLPRGARVLNVARGEIVDEPALVAALEQGRLAGAYLDVFAQEPLPAHSPLWSLANVIATPHNSAASRGNEARQLEVFLDNLARYGRGEPLRNEVRAPSGP
ncbi:MAG TPA: D-2-hydroxyacid dehydrogenase [Myxococcota bacterium]|nr:D-2-hydroxyacid dehydrogenase [Myxococcota bacterium]